MNLYHSTIIEIDSQNNEGRHHDLAQSYLEQLNLPLKTSFIFLNTEAESFKIAQVRDLKIQAQYGKADNEPMVFVICHAEKITIPAQNALLKLLEEPPANTMLVLVANTDHQLLPTIESRCRIEISAKVSNTGATDVELPEVSFLIEFFKNPRSTGYSDLIDLSEKLKDRDNAIKTLRLVLKKLHQNIGELDTKHLTQSMHLITTAIDSLQKNGNVRLVLEDCFFTFKKSN